MNNWKNCLSHIKSWILATCNLLGSLIYLKFWILPPTWVKHQITLNFYFWFFCRTSEHLSTVHRRCFHLCSTFWVFYISLCLWEWHFFLFPLGILVASFASCSSENIMCHTGFFSFECDYWGVEELNIESISVSCESLESFNLVELASSTPFAKQSLCFY